MNYLLSQKKVVDEYLKKQKRFLSSYAFVNVFAWKDFFEFEFKTIDECLCIFAKSEIGTFMYLPPLGERVLPQTIDQCFEIMRKENKASGVTRIENVSQEDLELFPKQKYSWYLKSHEYCYLKEDIAHLKGNAFKSKRSSYNQFVKNNRYDYVDYDPSMSKECVDLYKAWAFDRRERNQDEIYRQMLDDNQAVHRLVLENAHQLDLIGRVVKVGGRIKAYSLGYELNEETFCTLFEIADLSIKGLSVFIFSEFAKDAALKKYQFINVMDDFEMKSVKETKMSFHPKHVIPVYTVTEKS